MISKHCEVSHHSCQEKHNTRIGETKTEEPPAGDFSCLKARKDLALKKEEAALIQPRGGAFALRVQREVDT